MDGWLQPSRLKILQTKHSILFIYSIYTMPAKYFDKKLNVVQK